MVISALAGVRAYPVLRAEDLNRAGGFYRDVLGLEVTQEPAPARELRASGADGLICIYERPGFPAPQNTVACFEVADLRQTVDEFRVRGVVFEEYDLPEVGLVTADGIARVNGRLRAWFRDSEGNTLVLTQA